MSRSIRLLIACIFIIMMIMTDRTIAQSPEWVVYNKLNTPLPSNAVTKVIIDKNNTKWISIGKDKNWDNGGLVMFDGSNWKVYRTKNSQNSFMDFGDMAMDSSGSLYLLYFSFYLYKFDKEKFVLVPCKDSGRKPSVFGSGCYRQLIVVRPKIKNVH